MAGLWHPLVLYDVGVSSLSDRDGTGCHGPKPNLSEASNPTKGWASSIWGEGSCPVCAKKESPAGRVLALLFNSKNLVYMDSFIPECSIIWKIYEEPIPGLKILHSASSLFCVYLILAYFWVESIIKLVFHVRLFLDGGGGAEQGWWFNTVWNAFLNCKVYLYTAICLLRLAERYFITLLLHKSLFFRLICW